MKIFPLKPLSNIDKFNNLMSAIGELSQCSKPKMTDMIEKAAAQKPNYDREINVLGRPYTIRELRSMYKDALKQLSRDRFEKR